VDQAIRILIGALALALPQPAHAERYVLVNGERMSIPQIQALERARCGPIPNGNYWLDYRSGIWGYAGNPRPQGHIADNCRSPGRRPSLSERGMLFSPGDWTR
jgi:hypothetical protein